MTDLPSGVRRLPSWSEYRRRLPTLSLATRVALATALLLTLVLGLAWLGARAQLTRELQFHLNHYGSSLSRQAALAATPLAQANDLAGLGQLLDSLREDGHVLGAVVHGNGGLVLVERPAPTDAVSGARRAGQAFVAPLEANGQRIGFLRLELNADELAADNRATLRRLGLAFLALVFLGTAGAWHASRLLKQRLDTVRTRVAELLDGKLDPAPHEPPRQDEAGRLLEDLERLRQHLAQRRQIERQQARFAPSPLAQCLRLDESGELASGRYLHATLLLVEYVNLGPLSEKLSPTALAELLNTYHALLARAGKLYAGQIDKYYGDGVLVLFGIPRQDEEHAFHALCAALLFHQLVLRFNETRGPDQSLQVRLTLHTGGVLAAVLGGEQAQFTILGDALNLIMRLTTVAGPDEIVLSRELAELPELKQRVLMQPHRNVLIKGRTEPSPTQRLLGLQAPYDQLLDGQVQHLLNQLGLTAPSV